MPRKLLVGLIASGCVTSVFAQSAHSLPTCSNNQLQVIESTAASYKVGACLSQNNKIRLKAGEKLILQLQEANRPTKKARIVEGPYSDNVARDKGLVGTLLDKLAELIGVIGLRKPSYSCGIWDLDVSQDNAFCFKSTTELKLCRTKTDRAVWLEIKNSTGDKKFDGRWPQDKHLKAWPQNKSPISDGVSYIIKMGQRPRKVTFHEIKPGGLSGNYEAIWMVEKGCYRQAGIHWPTR